MLILVFQLNRASSVLFSFFLRAQIHIIITNYKEQSPNAEQILNFFYVPIK